MESAIYFLLGGSAIVFMIMVFDIQQRRRVSKILKNTQTVQPLFLMRATEEKLRKLNTILYSNMPMASSDLHGDRVVNEGARQLVASQLSKLASDYNKEKVSLKTYHTQLGEMLNMVNGVKGMSFEQIN
jgi:hypothetical protein